MKYFTPIISITIALLLLYACSDKIIKLNKNYQYDLKQANGSYIKLNLNSDFTYEYESRIENLKSVSYGTYSLNKQTALLNSRFDRILDVEVAETFDKSVYDSIEIILDSNMFRNSIICNLTVFSDSFDSTSFHFRRTNDCPYTIKFKPNYRPASIKLDFSKGFQSNRVFLKSSQSNKFSVAVKMPDNLYSYIVFNSYKIYVSFEKVILTNPKLTLKRVYNPSF